MVVDTARTRSWTRPVHTPYVHPYIHTVCTGRVQLLRPAIEADRIKFEELMRRAPSGEVFASLFENKAGLDKAGTAMGQSTIYAGWAHRQCATQLICVYALRAQLTSILFADAL